MAKKSKKNKTYKALGSGVATKARVTKKLKRYFKDPAATIEAIVEPPAAEKKARVKSGKYSKAAIWERREQALLKQCSPAKFEAANQIISKTQKRLDIAREKVMKLQTKCAKENFDHIAAMRAGGWKKPRAKKVAVIENKKERATGAAKALSRRLFALQAAQALPQL